MEEGGGGGEGGGVVAEEMEGVGFGVEEGFFAQPGALALGVPPVAGLSFGDGLLAGEGALEDGEGLRVAEGAKGSGEIFRWAVAAEALEEAFGFLEEAAVEHGGGSVVDAMAQIGAGWVEGEAEDAEAGEGFSAAVLPLGGEVLAGGEAEGEGAEELGGVVGVDGLGGAGVETGKEAMEMGGGVAGGEGTEAVAQGGIDGGCGKEAVEERAEIEAGAADDERKTAAGGDAVDSFASMPGPVAGGEGLVGVDEVEAVVGDEGAIFRGGLGGADLHAAVDGDGVAGEDFGGEVLRKAEGEVGFAGGGGTGEDDEVAVCGGGRGYHKRHQPGVKARWRP